MGFASKYGFNRPTLDANPISEISHAKKLDNEVCSRLDT